MRKQVVQGKTDLVSYYFLCMELEKYFKYLWYCEKIN